MRVQGARSRKRTSATAVLALLVGLTGCAPGPGTSKDAGTGDAGCGLNQACSTDPDCYRCASPDIPTYEWYCDPTVHACRTRCEGCVSDSDCPGSMVCVPAVCVPYCAYPDAGPGTDDGGAADGGPGDGGVPDG